MTVEQALAQWPNLLASGLRLGSPAPTDGGLSWLYEFIDEADARDYRVDFVAVHYYQGCKTPRTSGIGWKPSIIARAVLSGSRNSTTGPTGPVVPPTLSENADKIEDFIEMLDNAPFVERYAIYNWVGRYTSFDVWTAVTWTAAGEVYRDDASPMAYIQKPNDRSGGDRPIMD